VHLPSRYRHCLPGGCSSSLVGGPSIARSSRSLMPVGRIAPLFAPTVTGANPKVSPPPRPPRTLPTRRSEYWPPEQEVAAWAGYSSAPAKAAAREPSDGQDHHAPNAPRRILTGAAIRPPRSASSGSRSSSCFQKIKTCIDYCRHMAGLRHHAPWNEKRHRNRSGCMEGGQFDKTSQAYAMNLPRPGSGGDVAAAQRQRKRQMIPFQAVTDWPPNAL